MRYLALCLTSCAAVAVLGARRPGVTAWNFVVLSQLAILLVPIAEGLGEVRLDPLRLAFLAATLAVGALNYLPTHLAAATVAAAIGCGVELALVRSAPDATPVLERAAPFARCLLAASPWLAFFALRGKRLATSPFDRLWLGFRDCYGLVWGQRVREQFNRSVGNAGWPVVLRWRGLRVDGEKTSPGDADRAELLATLRALLKRFEPETNGAEHDSTANQ